MAFAFRRGTVTLVNGSDERSGAMIVVNGISFRF
jgi:hypothetical protein